jgi:hypothetical protein
MIVYRIGLLGAAITLAIGCTANIDAVTSGPDGAGGEMSTSSASGVGGNGATSSVTGTGTGGTTVSVGVGAGGAMTGSSTVSVGAGGAGGVMTGSSTVSVGVGGEGGYMTGSSTVSVGAGGEGGFMSSSSSGMGGAPATSSSVTGVGGGPACGTPDPVGQLSFCGGTATGSSGGMLTCTVLTCDDNGNTWDASCGDSGCTCSYNSQPVCSCNFDPGETACTGMGCCPMPWVNP